MARPLPISDDPNPPEAIKDIVAGMAKRIAEIKDKEMKNLLSKHELWRDDMTVQQLALDLNTKGYTIGEIEEPVQGDPNSKKYTYTLFKIVDQSSFTVSTTYHLDIKDNKENEENAN